MKQEKIMDLLREVASLNLSNRRVNEIQCKLTDALPRSDALDDREAGMEVVLGKLYVDTLRNKPHLLPMLFPVFAIMCGDRDDGFIVADVDWDII